MNKQLQRLAVKLEKEAQRTYDERDSCPSRDDPDHTWARLDERATTLSKLGLRVSRLAARKVKP